MRAILCMLVLVAAPAAAQDAAPLPDFAACLDAEIARYERALAHQAPGTDAFEIGGTGGVEYCGSVGIVRCDRGDDPVPCQHALARQQDALRAQVMATLPPPETVAGLAGAWSDGLYPQVWALAHGRSAGPDCAGQSDVMTAWCTTRAATRRLETAILLWQLARWLDAAPPATEAGWATAPEPVRPVARPRRAQDQ